MNKEIWCIDREFKTLRAVITLGSRREYNQFLCLTIDGVGYISFNHLRISRNVTIVKNHTRPDASQIVL
jgi:hypothetical protein